MDNETFRASIAHDFNQLVAGGDRVAGLAESIGSRGITVVDALEHIAGAITIHAESIDALVEVLKGKHK